MYFEINVMVLLLAIVIMMNMLSSRAVDRGFEHPLGQTKDNKIGIFYFSAKCAVLRRKSKHWMARNQDIFFLQNNMSTILLLYQ